MHFINFFFAIIWVIDPLLLVSSFICVSCNQAAAAPELWIAAKEGNLAMVQDCLAKGASVFERFNERVRRQVVADKRVRLIFPHIRN